MPYQVAAIEPTPNPNAVKVLVSPSPTATSEGRPRSYFNPQAVEPGTDPLAEALFQIEGVTSLLIHTEFIAVNKAPEAKWPPIRTALKQTLADAP